MHCENALELLSASLDGVLTPDEEAQLQAHLDTCPDCRALRAELAALHEACAGMDVLPPAGLKEQILSNLPAQKTAKVVYWKRWGAMAAALAIVALAAWRLPHSLYQEPKGVDAVANDMAQTMVTFDEDALEALQLPGGQKELADIVTGAGGGDTATGAVADHATDSIQETAAVMKRAAEADSGAQYHQESVQEAGGPQEPVANYSFRGHGSLGLGDSDTVWEDAPDVPESAPVSIALDPALEVQIDFSHYCAVVTLTEGSFEGEYLRQIQDNGDVWYLLPRSVLYDDALELSQLLPAYELRTEGEDLTPDAFHVLLIVPAAQ